MAIMTSFNSNFEISEIKFNPAVILPGQETTYTISVKNTSGRRINNMYANMKMFYRDTSGTVRQSQSVLVFGAGGFEFKNISWAANATKTFTGAFKVVPSPSYPIDTETRTIPLFKGSEAGYPADYGGNETFGLALDFATDSTFSDGSNSDIFFNLRGENSEYLLVLDARYNPTITVFDAERSNDVDPDDEGENLLATLALATSTSAKLQYLRLELRYRARGNTSEAWRVIDITNVMSAALSRTIVTLISEIFEKNTDWDVMLWFGDRYESVSSAVVVSRAFANVHLSGASTGGVCFGAFSQATEDNPLFQCYYPTHFYAPVKFHAGIEGGNDYVLGEVATGGHWIDGKMIYRYVFTATSSNRGTFVIGKLPSKPKMLINTFGVSKDTSAGSFIFIPNAYYGSASWTVAYNVNENDEIVVQMGSGFSGEREYVLIFEYTKTTEEAS